MSTELDKRAERPLHEVVKFVEDNIELQCMGHDVAVDYVCGAPGGGKTASLQALATDKNKNEKGEITEANWAVLSTHFALKPMEETGGIPQFQNIQINGQDVLATIWSFPDIMKNLYVLAGQYQKVVWLLDDMHLCGAVHNALLYELLTERKLREYVLPQNVGLVLAGNHSSNKAGAKTMFSAIMNRVALMPVRTSYDAWKKNYAIPAGMHPAVLSFLGQDNYQQFFHEEEQVDSPWGSPRSWSRFSTLIQYYESKRGKITDKDTLYMSGAHVSKEAASEFSQYYNVFMEFDIPQILQGIDHYEIPNEPIKRYALAYAAVSHFAGRNDRNSIVAPFSKLVYKFIKNYEDLGLMLIHEIIDIEAILKKAGLFIMIGQELDQIEPDITGKLLEEIQGVE